MKDKVKGSLLSLIFRGLLVFVFMLGIATHQSRSVQAVTTLRFDPNQLDLSLDESRTVKLTINTNEKLLGTDLVINYDPKVIEVNNLINGDFWQQPQELVNRNDDSIGKLSFSAFSYPAKAGSGSLVQFSVRLLTSKNSTLSLDTSTVIALEKGVKASYTTSEAKITAKTAPTVTPTTPDPIEVTTSLIPSTDQATAKISATVATTSSEETGPKIILEQTPTPIPDSTKNSSPSYLLQIVALFLLIFGTLAFFTFKKNF